MWDKHPSVIGEEQLQGLAHGEDQGDPQASAEEQATQDALTLVRQVATARETELM